MHLQAGSLLGGGKYKIEKVLGQGGFGITYLAEQTSLGRKVALKEFFMEGLCNRDAATSNVSVGSVGSKKLVERFKQKFIKEARMIASFDNAHIISIHDVFEENGTAYYVMEYLGGKSLSAIVNEQGIMSETLALKYIRQVADALAEVHANNLLHLDVKPANIMLNKKGEAVLIDFGISKHYDEAGNQTSSALIGTSEGYAPLEQYEAGALDSFTPATDIYALGATLFFLLTGTRPPKASEVMNYGLPELPSGVSASVRSTIETAMQPAIAKRPQSIAEFLCLVENGNVKGENGKLKDESDGETELNGNVKGENGKLVANEFHSIDVVEVPDSADAVILSVSEESHSASPVISNESEKSNSADAVIFRGKPSTARLSVSEESQPANNEILRSAQNDNSTNGRQNDKDGKEEVESRNEKERSAGAVISNESEKSQKIKPGKSLWPILLLLLVAVAGAWFMFGGTGNGDAPKTDTTKTIEKKVNVSTGENKSEVTIVRIYVTNQEEYFIQYGKGGPETVDNFEELAKNLLKYKQRENSICVILYADISVSENVKRKIVDVVQENGMDIKLATKETDTLYSEKQPFIPTLEESTTELYVTTTPSGAQVFIDNKSIDKTPIKGYEIPQGTHNIKITKDGYKDYNEKIEASAGPYVINETLEENPKPVLQDNSFKTREFSVNGVSFKMISVAGGKFRMGSDDGEDDEKPVHDVTVGDYYIGETEVTQALWEAVMEETQRAKAGDSKLYGIGYDYPMYYISYDDCVAFVKKLNENLKASGQLPAGREFRLPTEAEWEFAARGGNFSRGYQYSGSNTLSSVAWYGESWDTGSTHPVKKKQANELGLYDMSGNVWEWCYDSYSDYPTLPQTNPKVYNGPGSNRVLRGGSWNGNAQNCRVANRYSYSPDYRISNYGLRLAL